MSGFFFREFCRRFGVYFYFYLFLVVRKKLCVIWRVRFYWLLVSFWVSLFFCFVVFFISSFFIEVGGEVF